MMLYSAALCRAPPLLPESEKETMLKIQRGRLKRTDAGIAIGCASLVVVCFIFDMNLSTSLIPKFSSSIEIQEITSSDLPPPLIKSNSPRISCDRSHREYDICTVHGRVTLDQTKPTFVTQSLINPILEEKLRPYPRKWESFRMSSIKEMTLVTSPEVEPCQVSHDVPALVFSAGGYTGNFFHDFNDGFIPLFITINDVFDGSDDIILIISNAKDWWMQKYGDILRAFSKYPVIGLDNHNTSHCFKFVSVGLVSHGFMTIEPKRVSNGKNFSHFLALLDKAYGSKGAKELKGTEPVKLIKPRLVLASRSGSGGRVITNQNEVKSIAMEEGFEVIEFEPTSATQLKQSYELLQSSHVLIGVHGAALTHMLFLRPGSTFLQIIPIGAEWVSEACFGKPAKDMGLEYVQYKILANESSLTDKYGVEHPLIRDPVGSRGGWKNDIMEIYLKQQNVKLDLERFRHYLKKMYSKVSLGQIT